MAADEEWNGRLFSNWESNAVALPLRTPIMSKAEVFRYLCLIGSTWQGKHRTLRAHFATEFGEVEVHKNVFPKQSDLTFEKYYARVTDELNTCSALLYLRNITHHSDGLVREIDKILAPLWMSGFRWQRLEIELYIGRYEWTAIGIHREPCGNIHQVLYGEKEILVWPPHALTARTDRPECATGGASFYEASMSGLLKNKMCKSFSARNGEAVYFPSRHWHVGVSKCISVSLDLSLYGCGGSVYG